MSTEDPKVKEIRLNRLAGQLKKDYVSRRTALDKRPYRPHARFDTHEVWKQAAVLCDRLRATPEDFMAAQFRYRTSTVFANTLHGPTAEKCYKRFVAEFGRRATDATGEATTEHTGTPHSPGIAELRSRIADHKMMLQHKTGSMDTCTEQAIKVMLESPWHFDPLTVMLLVSHDARICKEYARQAREELDNEPYLRAAAKMLELDTTPVYEYTNY